MIKSMVKFSLVATTAVVLASCAMDASEPAAHVSGPGISPQAHVSGGGSYAPRSHVSGGGSYAPQASHEGSNYKREDQGAHVSGMTERNA